MRAVTRWLSATLCLRLGKCLKLFGLTREARNKNEPGGSFAVMNVMGNVKGKHTQAAEDKGTETLKGRGLLSIWDAISKRCLENVHPLGFRRRAQLVAEGGCSEVPCSGSWGEGFNGEQRCSRQQHTFA